MRNATNASTASKRECAAVWEIMRRNEEGESVVVIPSFSVDRVGERSGFLAASVRGAVPCSHCCS